ncbi:amidohydrolase family protein [Nonomuraea monospora]|uniref:Amidohydrolase family protein n=1 Tax=Nonomuraea monospora TaxID=568818 RepID=A0ABN3CSR1_9ACTN
MDRPGRIDTHQHIVPPFYASWLSDQDITAGGLPIPGWSRDDALAVMDGNGITTAIVSVSTPGVYVGDGTAARAMAQRVNEFTAEVVKDRPDRFGFFATLTLPDVPGAIAEAEHAFEVLGADGPSTLPAPPLPGIPPYAADFLLDTTRAAINLVRGAVFDRHPNLKIILSHAGGFLPYAAERIATSFEMSRFEGLMADLGRFFFDTALSASPSALPTLLQFADPTRITFGSDWPYASAETAAHFTTNLTAYPLEEGLRTAIDRGNAEALFPRLAGRSGR